MLRILNGTNISIIFPPTLYPFNFVYMQTCYTPDTTNNIYFGKQGQTNGSLPTNSIKFNSFLEICISMYKLGRCFLPRYHSYHTNIRIGWSHWTEHLKRRSSWRHSMAIGSSWLNREQKYHVQKRFSSFRGEWRLCKTDFIHIYKNLLNFLHIPFL